MPRHKLNYCSNVKHIKSLKEYEPYRNRFCLNSNESGLSFKGCFVVVDSKLYNHSTPTIIFCKSDDSDDKKIIINIHTKEIIYDDFPECDYRFKKEFIYFVEKHYVLLMQFWHSGDLMWYSDNLFEFSDKFFLTKEEINEIWK